MSEAQAKPATQPYQQFEEITRGFFGVSKQELDAKIAEEKAKRQAERERKRRERQEAQK